ncbi:MAG: hypothetical protein WA902_23820 [Thermosynechococcaceae cyanobacterium]
MATAAQLLAKFKSDFPGAGAKIEGYGAIARDQLLAESVKIATDNGISLEYGGLINDGPQTIQNTVFMPNKSYKAFTDI